MVRISPTKDALGRYQLECSNPKCNKAPNGLSSMKTLKGQGQVNHYKYQDENISMRDPLFQCLQCGQEPNKETRIYEMIISEFVADKYAEIIEMRILAKNAEIIELYNTMPKEKGVEKLKMEESTRMIQELMTRRIVKRQQPEMFPDIC